MSQESDADRVRSYCEEHRNWGRWGEDDQAGTLNHIGADKIVQAAHLVRKGKVFSLAIPFDSGGPQTGRYMRFNPMHFMTRDGSDTMAGPMMGCPTGCGAADDVVMMPTHAATHWDALAHGFFLGKMYNGYDASLVNSLGAEKNGIEHAADKIVTRGVLLDIARFKGVDHLEAGEAITGADLDGAAACAGLEVTTGDIVLVRTGFMAHCRQGGSWGSYSSGEEPGLSFWTGQWLQAHEVAGIAADTYAVEVQPNELGWVLNPWHRLAIPNMGLLVGEIFDLEALAADCAQDGTYEFLFVAPPLPLTGCVGSPVNPLAIK